MSSAGRILRSGAKRFGRAAPRLLGSIRNFSTAEPLVALTFDDGPDELQTPRLLDALKDRGVRATFFMLADRAVRFPEVAGRVVDEGHEVGLHTASHPSLPDTPFLRKREEIWRAKRRLEAAIGSRVSYFRPPYGWQDGRSFLLARAARMEVVAWTADAHDWTSAPEEEMAEAAVAALEPGGILLLHDRFEPLPGEAARDLGLDRASLLWRILDGAESSGLRFTTVGGLIESGSAVKSPWFDRPAAG